METQTDNYQAGARESALGTFEAITEVLKRLEQAECAHKDFTTSEPPAASSRIITACDYCNADLTEDGEPIAELDVDAIREELQEMPLSVQVRENWHDAGETGARPAEFELLMGTGGPAVRIRGDLDDYGQPTRAYLQAQDWGTPWFDVFPPAQSGDALLVFAREFYYGEGA